MRRVNNSLLAEAARIARGRQQEITIGSLLLMCRAFGGWYWIGKFDYPSHDPGGIDERVLALCMAAAILA